MEKTLNLVKNDPWLEPFAGAITGRHQHVLDKEAELTNKGKQTLSDFASGYLYFGLHRTDKGWTFREWAPNATHIYMVCTLIVMINLGRTNDFLIIGRKKLPTS